MDDQEALELALRLLDEPPSPQTAQQPAPEPLLPVTRPRLVPLLPRPATELPAAAAGPARPKRRRPAGYNPNRAREQRKREAEALRLQIAELERHVGLLSVRSKQPPVGDGAADVAGAKIWQRMCKRQLQRRVTAERENLGLRQALQAQLQMASRIERALGRAADREDYGALVASVGQRIQPLRADPRSSEMDRAIFDKLFVEAESAYAYLDTILAITGLRDCQEPLQDALVRDDESGMCLDVFSNKMLPFDVRAVGTAAWRHYQGGEKHQGRLYSKSFEPRDDLVLEKFSLELYANNTWADLQVWQVVRKFEFTAGRVVLVWVSHVEPVEVSHKLLSGIGFQETGYVVCKRPLPPAPPGYSILQICYRIMPNVTRLLAAKMKHDGPSSTSVRALTAFAISLAKNNVRAHQSMIENALIDAAAQEGSPWMA